MGSGIKRIEVMQDRCQRFIMQGVTAPMKWPRRFLALALLGLVVSCTNPTAPRFPDPDDETQEEDPPPTQGQLIAQLPTFWV